MNCRRYKGMGSAKPLHGAEGRLNSKFSIAEELLDNPNLKAVFKEALEKGAGLYSPRDSK
jgi:hypothetical protein